MKHIVQKAFDLTDRSMASQNTQGREAMGAWSWRAGYASIFLLWACQIEARGASSMATVYRSSKQQGLPLDLRDGDNPKARANILKLVQERIQSLERECQARARPFVTLCYAQCLDGSIAMPDRTAVNISSPATLVLAHQLRAAHDCILIGAGTAKADNPRLTVRHGLGVRRRRADPRPVLLLSADNQAQVDLTALRLHNPIIFTPDLSRVSRAGGVGQEGARRWEVVQCAAAGDGRRCDLKDCLRRLWHMGYRRLMVEGGTGVISAFASAELVDVAVVSLSPRYLGGYRIFQQDSLSNRPFFTRLRNAKVFGVGPDVVLTGRPEKA